MSSASSRTREEVKVGVRCKIAALWIAMLFLFAYGDIVGFFSPGQLQEVMAGELSGMASTHGFLFAVWLYIAIASVMVDQHRLAEPVRRFHRGVGDREPSASSWLLSIAESALLLGIVWYAWTWPRREPAP